MVEWGLAPESIAFFCAIDTDLVVPAQDVRRDSEAKLYCRRITGGDGRSSRLIGLLNGCPQLRIARAAERKSEAVFINLYFVF
jgi:hypothetical protein